MDGPRGTLDTKGGLTVPNILIFSSLGGCGTVPKPIAPREPAGKSGGTGVAKTNEFRLLGDTRGSPSFS